MFRRHCHHCDVADDVKRPVWDPVTVSVEEDVHQLVTKGTVGQTAEDGGYGGCGDGQPQ